VAISTGQIFGRHVRWAHVLRQPRNRKRRSN
jgi:hypothetical protein